MKRKRLSMFLTAMLCAGAVVLPAAGGTGGQVYGAGAASGASAQIGGKTAQLVYVNPALATPEIALAGDSVVSDRAAKSIIQDTAQSAGKSVLAAVNGAYFNAYYKPAAGVSFPDNCARVYGTILRDGRLINGGGTNRTATLGFDGNGGSLIDWVALSPKVTFDGPISSIHWPDGQRSFEITPWGLNNYYGDGAAVMQFTDEMTLPVTCPATSKLVYVSGGRVTKITGGGTFTVPKGGDVIVYNAAAVTSAMQWDQFPAEGDGASFSVTRTPEDAADQARWNEMTDAISVGPMILQNGVSVTGRDKVSEAKQAPSAVNQKSFAAVMSDGRLLLGTCVASYDQIAAYLSSIGARDAMSLDGGASSALYTAEKGFVKPAGRNLSNMIVFLSKPAEVYVPFSNPNEKSGDFTDVKGSWAEAYINKVMDRHMYSGLTKTSFGPEGNMTRAMFVTALGRYAEAQGETPSPSSAENAAYAAQRFSDVKSGMWYTPYVGWAEKLGLVSGTGEATFSPDAPIEREQLCVIMERYLGRMGKTIPEGAQAESFSDDGQISGWAREAVYSMKKAAIVNGYADKTFRPHGNVTRAEAAAMLVNALGL